MTCRAGIFFSSASVTTTAASQAAENRDGFERELDGTGAIDECDLLAHEVDGGRGGLDAHGMQAGFGRMITNGVARGYCVLALDRAGSREDGF